MNQDRAETSKPTESTGTLKPVTGGAEMKSGELLLVEGYVVLWLLLMGFLLFVWRKQATLHRRLDDLENAIATAEKDMAKKERS